MRTASILRKATFGAVLVAAAIFATLPVRGADKRIVLIAGRPSHPPGMHEFRAGSLLLQKALSGVPGIKVDVYDMGWPAKMVDGARVDDSSLLDTADAVLIYADGGKGNPAMQGERMKVIDALAARGVGSRLRALRRRSARRRAGRCLPALDRRATTRRTGP